MGSGHFLVSCLNELIAIKSRLDILCDTDGKVLRQVDVTVENDELIVSWDGEGEGLFDYDVAHTWRGTRLESRRVTSAVQRVQQALFHEKRHLIENCLFGVDINFNSVKICRLRLWIELLKRAYYTPESEYLELEVLPNIDINIKQGNSLVSRFELDSDLGEVFKAGNGDTSKIGGHTLEAYKEAVRAYKHSGDRVEKQRLQKLINEIKDEYHATLQNNRPINKKLSRERGKLKMMQDAVEYADLFGDKKFSKKDIEAQKKKVRQLEAQRDEEESGDFYRQAFEWRFEFPEVLDDEGRFTGFDVVIGNPPYIRQEGLGYMKPYLQKTYKVYQGTADIYSYFIELGMNLLRRDGYFHYIVANKWMRANYGKALRKWMKSEVSVDGIHDFGDLPVFEEATTYPCLLQLKNAPPSGTFQATVIEHLDFDDLRKFIEEHRFEVIQKKLHEDGWALIDKQYQLLLDKIRSKGIPLGEYVNGKIFYGIKTGLNEAFVIDEAMKEKLIAEDPKSAEIIKPFLRGRDIKRYVKPTAEQYLIFTRRGIDIENYPAVLKHLEQFRERLEPRPNDVPVNQWKGRKPGSYKWYEIQDSIDYYEEFEKPKIILPDISLRGNFTFDEKGKFYLVNTAYIIVTDDKYLLGVLASNLIDFYYRNISSTYRGGYLRFIYQYLETIPIVEPDEASKKLIEEKVQQIMEAKSATPDADTSGIESEIDKIVNSIYSISYAASH